MKQTILKSWLLLVCLLVGVGTSWADSYTITFGNNVTSATALTSTVKNSTVIKSGYNYVVDKPFTVNGGNCYYGDTKTCIRLGKTGTASSLSIALSTAGQVKATQITVNCDNIGGNKNTDATLSVNGSAARTTTTSAADYNFTLDGSKIESITLAASASVRVYSITVTYNNAPASDPQIANFIKTSTIELEVGADPYDVRKCLNIPSDYDASAYAITTSINGLTQKDGEFACIYSYLSFLKVGTYTVTVKAAAIEGKYAETTGTITVVVKAEGEGGDVTPGEGGDVTPEVYNVTFDLTKDETVAASAELLAWTSTSASMYAQKASSLTDTNNYYPGTSGKTYTSTRFYKNSTLTVNPAPGVTITSIVYEAATVAYANTLESSTWTNAAAELSNYTVTVTPTDGTSPVSATLGAIAGVKSVTVYYTGKATGKPYIPGAEEPTTGTLSFVATDEEGAYYATFSSDKVTFWPNDYIVSAVGVENGEIYTFDNEEAFDEDIVDIEGEAVIGYYVPANTGVLVCSVDEIARYYTVEGVTPSTDVEAVNMLRPASAAKETDGSYRFYKLAYASPAKDDLGFYWGAADGAAFTSREGSAYLAVPAEAAAKGYSFVVDDATAIKGVENNKVQTNAVYNLAGQRVSSRNYKGIVIVNGKKIVNK